MEQRNENRPIAIQLSGLKKRYKLGQIGGGTLQGDIQSWWARIRGKEDPNTKIGQEQRLYGQTFMALNGIDATIYQGEAVGIIGSNGAGKSTLLKILSRVTAPTGGEVDIYGRIASMLEVGTGFNGEMTGRENVYLNGAILGMTKEEIDAKMEQIIEFSEVRDFIDTPVKRYSSGMYVKLAFSVAAHLDSEIMIMDEVLAVGDMAFQRKCLDRMRDAAKKEGRTVLYVSHNMNTIRQLCDRCIVLNQGKVVFEGDVDTAIGYYSNHSLSDDEVEIDLTQKDHVEDMSSFDIKMNHLTLLNKDVPIYNETENLTMKFQLDVRRSLSNVRYRMTLKAENEILIGTAWSEEMEFLETGEREITVSFPLHTLTKGKVYASVGFYQMNKGGSSAMLDHVRQAFKFEMIQKPKENNIIWLPSFWGHIRLPEIKVDCK